MSTLIKSKEDLISYLTTRQVASKSPPSEVYVTSSLRKLVLTGVSQDKFVYKGLVRRFCFKSVGGGVYKASIVNLESDSGDSIE